MPDLDTPKGQKYIDDFIEDTMGGCDLIIFDIPVQVEQVR